MESVVMQVAATVIAAMLVFDKVYPHLRRWNGSGNGKGEAETASRGVSSRELELLLRGFAEGLSRLEKIGDRQIERQDAQIRTLDALANRLEMHDDMARKAVADMEKDRERRAGGG